MFPNIMPLVHNILIRDPTLVIAYKALKGNAPIYLEDIMIMHEIAEFKEYMTPQYDKDGNLIPKTKPKSSNSKYTKPSPEVQAKIEEMAKQMREKLGIEEKILQARRDLGIEC